MPEKTIYDWGQTPPTAPTAKRVDPLGWIMASTVLGAIAALIAMSMMWRPLPGLAGPPGSLAEHVMSVFRLAVNALFHSAYRAEARAYVEALQSLESSARIALIWRCAVGVWVMGLVAIALFKSYMTPRDSLIHLRGSMRHDGEEAIAHLNGILSGRVKRRPDHEIAPGVVYPADMWTRHVLVVGGVGSGKSTAMKPLIDKVVKARERMILFDPKGEFTKGFASPSLIAPWDSRTCSWDVAKDMRNIGDMRRFAAAMIKEGQDPMWANASRQILVGFMIYLNHTRGTDWGWQELADLLAIPQGNLLPIMTKFHPEAIRAVERASVTTHGILINLASFCSAVFDLAEAWGSVPKERRISFVEWTQGVGRHSQVILQGHGAYPELTRGYVEGVVGVISAMVNSVEMDDDPDRKLWFIADELGQMGRIPIRPLFEVGRSRGVRCVVACQDLAQLEEIHGAQMVKALVSMSGTVLVGQMMQGDTAEQMAKALGTREVERANVSSSYAGTGGSSNRSTTLSFARDELAIYKPSELASRLGLTPDGSGVKLALFTGGHAYELFWPKFDMANTRAAHKPAAWTRGSPRGVGAEQSERPMEAALSLPPELDQDNGVQQDRPDSMQPDARADSSKAGSTSIARLSESAMAANIADTGERHEISVMSKNLDSDAVGHMHAGKERSGEAEQPEPDELTRLLQESIEVSASVAIAPESMPTREEARPLSEAMANVGMSVMGAQILGEGSHLVQAIELVEESRPGPKEDVRMVQRAPHQAASPDAGLRIPSKAPVQQATRSSK